MKIAYLISAYTDPDQLRRLCEALDGTDVHFFIHIDAKSNLDDFYFEHPHITWLPVRCSVTWGGYSQVRVISSMIKTALNYDSSFDRLVSLTGTDYPVWSNQSIIQYFEAHPQVELLACQPVSGEHEYLRMPGDLRSESLPGHAERFLRKNLYKIMPKKSKFIPVCDQSVPLYKGSDYWAITGSCAAELMRMFDSSGGFRKWMKTAFIPSEKFMQTLFMASCYRDNGILKPEDADFTEITPLHYVVYEEKVRILTEADYDDILASGKPFFRKCQSGVSDGLVAMIDHVRGTHSD